MVAAIAAGVAWWPKFFNIDSVAYRLVASDPLQSLPANFAVYGSRRFVPTVVWALPVSDPLGFRIVTALSLVATVVLLWRLVEAVSDKRRAVFGIALFLASPATTSVFRNPELVDAPLFACIAGALYAAVARRWWMAAAFLAIAPLIKEPGWLLMPVVAALAVAARDRAAALPTTVAALFAVGAVGLLYHSSAIFPIAGAAPLTSFDYHMDQIRTYATLPEALGSAVLLSWGPVWVSALLGMVWSRSRVLLALALLVPLVAIGMPATSEWIRLLVLAFPAVIAATCALPWRSTLAMAAFAVAYAALMVVGRGPVLYGTTGWELPLLAVAVGICVTEASNLVGRPAPVVVGGPRPGPP